MKIVIAIALIIVLPTLAAAGTDCTTRRSGRVQITSCSSTNKHSSATTCRSYYSGSVLKTSCR